MQLVPVTLKEANDFVEEHHRHSRPVLNWRFGVGLKESGALVGVAIAGRPVARMRNQYEEIEILRVCTDGTPNACSMLYGAVTRAAKALGYTMAITYTRIDEDGASLKASGWVEDGITDGGQWDRPSRQRIFNFNCLKKRRWIKPLNGGKKWTRKRNKGS